jgi:hypothetical protein
MGNLCAILLKCVGAPLLRTRYQPRSGSYRRSRYRRPASWFAPARNVLAPWRQGLPAGRLWVRVTLPSYAIWDRTLSPAAWIPSSGLPTYSHDLLSRRSTQSAPAWRMGMRRLASAFREGIADHLEGSPGRCRAALGWIRDLYRELVLFYIRLDCRRINLEPSARGGESEIHASKLGLRSA